MTDRRCVFDAQIHRVSVRYTERMFFLEPCKTVRVPAPPIANESPDGERRALLRGWVAGRGEQA
ncbi:MAG: hypothetical protein R3F62_26775 [Planctomycetota bacterium]